MLEDRAGGNASGSVFAMGGSAVLPPFQSAVTMPSRARFYVELKPGETTFVSWKKLIKEFQKAGPPSSSEAPVGAHPALEARIAPEVGDPFPPPPNRFNSVIEKIERIYKGGNSSDENENLSDLPDDDQYDTQDSFIDDTELNEYFSVDKAKTKHKGFFVNRGKLERETEPVISPITVPKKRKRKDIKKLSSELNEDISKTVLNSGVRLKAAARKVPLSAVGIPASSDNVLLALPSSNKQTIQKERKESQESLSGHETEKVTEKSISESDYVNIGASNIVAIQCTKESSRDGTEGRGVSKDDAAGRYVDHPLNMNGMVLEVPEKCETNYSVKNDGLLQLDQKETAATIPPKVKSAQKGAKEEDSREIINVAGQLHSGNTKSSPSVNKDVSPGRPKRTALEKAFQDLERGVAQLCPPLAVREPEQGKRNRIPRDIKQKLAKVARLAQAKQGRITDELIERLMKILGHVMRVKTLKRNLKAMIEMGLSAMQEKEGRLQDIKREVTEMVKSRVHTIQGENLEQEEISSDDFQPLGGSAEKPGEGRYQWDHATEDKICDLYEQYIEGMDEHRGPQIRKLYAELAELWPDGWMDNNGIKHAVHRAKERKKQQSKASSSKEESGKRRRSSGKQKMELGALRFPLLELNLQGQDLSPCDKSQNQDVLQSEVRLNYGSKAHPSTGEKRKYIRKSPGKGFGCIEKKRNKLEGSPLLKKKMKRKLEKGVLDAMVPKVCSTNSAFFSSGAKEMSPESPQWNLNVQPPVTSPMIE